MADREAPDAGDGPTEPLPASTQPLPREPAPASGDPVVAAHVPVADLDTAPFAPASGVPASSGTKPPSRTWLWVIIAVLGAGTVAAIVTGLVLQQPAIAPSPTPGVTDSSTPTPSAPVEQPPADEPSEPSEEPEPAPEPTEPPAPEPEPTEPAPTETPAS